MERIVVASAGTGKTRWLAQRYLELLVDHSPLEVGAITFTRRAAGELIARILQALREESIDERLRQRRESLLSALPAAPIGTIHAFAAHNLRLVAPLLGLDPRFEVLDPAVARLWFEEALRAEALARGWDLEALPPEQEELLRVARWLWDEFGHTGQQPQEAEERLEEALDLFRQARARYLRRLNGRRADPAELERRWIQALRNPRARARIAARIKAVLVDELQDTSAPQFEALALLEEAGVQVEGVGDPKQSIYGFRSADLAGFLAALKRARGVQVLDRSFRHAPRVQEFLNRIVAKEASYADAAWPQQAARPVQAVRQTPPGQVEVALFSDPKGIGAARAREAQWLAQRLLALRGEGIPWDEMMVLVRTRHSLPPLLAALREQGVPFVVESGKGLYEAPEVRELVLALRYFAGSATPAEELAFLTGPFVGLSFAEAEQARGNPPEDLARWLARLRDRARILAPSEFLRLLLDEPSYRDGLAFWRRLDPAGSDTVLFVLGQLAGAETLEAAAERAEVLSHVAGEASALARPLAGAVRVMTVHAAKGLEARAVAVFDAGRLPRRFEDGAPYRIEGGALRRGGPEGGRGSVAEAGAEARRLLYVALSRAAEVLVVTGSARRGRNGEDETVGWMGVLLERWGVEPRVNPPLPRPGAVPVVSTPSYHEVSRAPVAAPPHVLSPTALAEHERVFDEVPEGELELARVVGILVHAGIERGWRPEEATSRLEAEQIFRELPEDARGFVSLRVRALLERYWQLIQEGELAPPETRDEDYREVPLAVRVGGTAWEGIADRIYRVGSRWVLEDYKTGAADHPEVYYAQLALYRRALEEAWGIRPEVRLVFLGGEAPKVYPVDEGALAAGMEQVLVASGEVGR